MMCRGMTDLSSDSQSSGGPEIAEEEEPENESIVEEQHLAAIQGRQVEMNSSEKSLIQVMDILPHQVLPGRSLAMPSAEQDQQNDEEDDDAEIEDSETESHRRLRYIYSSIGEGSDPEYWLHHFSSDDDDEASNSNRDDGN